VNRRLVIDSDVLIDYLRGRPGIASLFDQLKVDELAVSHMTYAELLTGELYNYERVTAKSRIERFLSGYTIYPIDETVLDRYAELNSLLRRQGKRIAVSDLLIAATALIHDRDLVTRNIRHFERIPNLRLIDANNS
jgi:predicted nucleic acid-binding protein